MAFSKDYCVWGGMEINKEREEEEKEEEQEQ